MKNTSITILGSGSYGTALAIRLAQNGNNVILWGRNKKKIKEMRKKNENKNFLPNIFLPKNLILETSLKTAIQSSKNILIAVPSIAFEKILKKIKNYVQKKQYIIWATKGLNNKTGELLSEIVKKILGKNTKMAMLSGPTFAKEIALGFPSTLVISSSKKKHNEKLQNILHNCKNFIVYQNKDIIGVQLAVIIKNIIAIASGISDGIGFGINTRTAIITQGLIEMINFGVAKGALLSTFIGISGLGDLILTCTNNQSRNKQFGILIGKGMNIEHAKKKINKTIEGLSNIKKIYLSAKKLKINMPITKEIYKILYQKKNIKKSINELLKRNTKKEIHEEIFKKLNKKK